MVAAAKINVLGTKTDIGVVLICAAVGAAIVIGVQHVIALESMQHPHRKHVREGLVGAPLKYKMQHGVPSAGPAMVGPPGEYSTWYTPLEANSQGLKVPLKKGELDIFAKNPARADCCTASTYSTSTGCVCVTPEQMQYLNQRGGNRTLTSEY